MSDPRMPLGERLRDALLALADRAEGTGRSKDRSSTGGSSGSRRAKRWFSQWVNPQIETHLLRRDGEIEVHRVHHHWISFVLPWAEIIAALCIGIPLMVISSADAIWVPFVLMLLVLMHGGYRLQRERKDVFVLTNRKVFRVQGFGPVKYAWTPLSRLVDVTVNHPVLGQILNYGHLILENAAQDQGLRRIAFIPNVDFYDREIQRLQSAPPPKPGVPSGDATGTSDSSM